MSDSKAVQSAHKAEDLQQPNNDNDDDNDIQDALDLSVHRYVGIDEPEQYTNDDQNKYDMK